MANDGPASESDPYREGDSFGEDRTGGSRFTYDRGPWLGGWGLGGGPGEPEVASGASDAELVAEGEADRRGLVSLLVLVGAALVSIPEPATSLLGVGFLVAGVVGWLVRR